jgi:hypothetical protein
MEFLVVKVTLEQIFGDYFGFNLIIIISELLHGYVSSETGITGPFDAAVPVDLASPYY